MDKKTYKYLITFTPMEPYFFGGERKDEVLLLQPLIVCRVSGPAVVPLVQEVSGNVHVFRSSSLCER